MFLPNSFKPNSFLPVSWRMGGIVPTQDGRSGYWRLFFTQLQEEALKKDDQKAESPSSPAPQEAVAGQSKQRAKRRVAKVQRAEPPAPPPERIPLILHPIVQQPNTYDALANLPLLPQATVFSFEVYRNEVIITRKNESQRRQKRRRAAAFLLLAA